MKCKGKIKTVNSSGKVIYKKCNADLDEHAIFCDTCGEPTDALSTGLSAKKNFCESWNEFRIVKSRFYPFSIFILLTAFLLIILALFVSDEIAMAVPLNEYMITNILLLFLVPLALIPFAMEANFLHNPLTISQYFKALKYYPKYFMLTLYTILFFALLKILCAGYLLNITIDPILHPVRLILVLHWLTIMFPALLLVRRKNVSSFKALIMCYKASAETRWQQFFILLYILYVNVLGILALGAGLLVSIPLSFVIIEKYYHSLDEYELFE